MCHHRAVIRRLLALTAALTVLAAPAVAAGHPEHEPEGAACAPGTGTTVVVDLHPVQESLRVACAPGEQATVSAALTAAGFEPGPTTGMLESLSGERADTLPDTFWAMYLNTSDGLVGGPFGDAWTFANEGIDAGPVPVGTVLSFHLQDWNANPGSEPALALADLAPPVGAAPPLDDATSAPTAPSAAAGSSELAVPSQNPVSSQNPVPSRTAEPSGSGSPSATGGASPSGSSQAAGASGAGTSSSAPSTGESSDEPEVDRDGISGAIWILATVAVLAVVGGATLLIVRRRHQH